MVYRFKDAARLGHLNAAACGEVLQSLDGERRLTPANVVAVARPVESPLHGGFEWDDSAAADWACTRFPRWACRVVAEAYRLDRARYILRSIVVVRDADNPKSAIRAFVTVTGDETPADKPQTIYMSIEAALADPVKRDEIVSRARRELDEWRDRYKQIREFSDVFAAIDRVRDEVTR